MSGRASGVKGWAQNSKGSSEKGLQSRSKRKVVIFSCVTVSPGGMIGF